MEFRRGVQLNALSLNLVVAGRTMDDCRILPTLKKGRAFNHPDFGCLTGIPTLNVTNGCMFQCAYCYARGYSQAPQKGDILLYVNLPDLLKKDLSKKRALPSWMILNTASDCFQPHPEILEVTHKVVEILFHHGIGISFLTKGAIPQRFFDLLRQSPERIFAQIGLVSLSERHWKEYEPGTPPPEERLRNVARLQNIGIPAEIRIDPIIPFVTDTESQVAALFERLNELRVKRVTLSYLHLRPAIRNQLMAELSPLHRQLIDSCFRTQDWTAIGSSTRTKLLPKPVRWNGYERMRKIAGKFGITALVCRCKNPDLQGDLCGSSRARSQMRTDGPVQLPLFRC